VELESEGILGEVGVGRNFWWSRKGFFFHVKWVPVNTAWRVLGLRMEERPPGMEGSCEYIE
jgi:hypothetical protein